MKTYLLLIVLICMISCESKVDYEKPKDLIPKEQMIDLLYDMHLAVGTSNLRNKSLERDRNYMSLVYKKYNIDSTRFAISNIYYTSQIDEYEEIFEEVERRLEELQLKYESERDSIIKSAKNKKSDPNDSSKVLKPKLLEDVKN